MNKWWIKFSVTALLGVVFSYLTLIGGPPRPRVPLAYAASNTATPTATPTPLAKSTQSQALTPCIASVGNPNFGTCTFASSSGINDTMYVAFVGATGSAFQSLTSSCGYIYRLDKTQGTLRFYSASTQGFACKETVNFTTTGAGGMWIGGSDFADGGQQTLDGTPLGGALTTGTTQACAAITTTQLNDVTFCFVANGGGFQYSSGPADNSSSPASTWVNSGHLTTAQPVNGLLASEAEQGAGSYSASYGLVSTSVASYITIAYVQGSLPTPTATGTATPTHTPTSTSTATATSTHTATPTSTPTSTATPTATQTPTPTPTTTPTATPTPALINALGTAGAAIPVGTVTPVTLLNPVSNTANRCSWTFNWSEANDMICEPIIYGFTNPVYTPNCTGKIGTLLNYIHAPWGTNIVTGNADLGWQCVACGGGINVYVTEEFGCKGLSIH